MNTILVFCINVLMSYPIRQNSQYIILPAVIVVLMIVIYRIGLRAKQNRIKELEKINASLLEDNIKLKDSEKILLKLLKDKEAKMLKGNISPHFFKNTMTIVNNNAQKTLNSILNLIPVLNHIVYDSTEEYVTLGDEVQFVNKFLALHEPEISFGFNLEKDIQIREVDKRFKIIPMLLIDFIENAFKYTDLNDSGSTISILLKVNEDSNLVYEVKNTPLVKDVNKQGGFGSDNLRKRLALSYQNEAELIYKPSESEFIAKLIIPSYRSYNEETKCSNN